MRNILAEFTPRQTAQSNEIICNNWIPASRCSRTAQERMLAWLPEEEIRQLRKCVAVGPFELDRPLRESGDYFLMNGEAGEPQFGSQAV